MQGSPFFMICVTNAKYLDDGLYPFISLFIHIFRKGMTIFRFLCQYIFDKNGR